MYALRTGYEQPVSISRCVHVRSTSLMVKSAATSTDATCCEKVKGQPMPLLDIGSEWRLQAELGAEGSQLYDWI